ncbi:MAG: HAD family hydrolase, partial [bacterium]
MKLIVFDWDGTLCDSLSRIALCMQLAARDAGLSQPAESEVREIVGLGLREAIQTLFPDADGEDIEALRQGYSAHFSENDRVPSPLYAGVHEALPRLRDKGLLLAVATGKSRRGLDRVLSAHDMTSAFHGSRCADETLSKPNPLMLCQLLDEFSVRPEEAVMVGDTEFDMEMAERAGVHRIAVTYGAHP